ncbi:hypothetical protein CALCODRAFT_69483 [Calocera cornea HHB12733]|uniref:Uncharacterized protein n=1 Tax=Calocera cornea HHB12733 TaxID=1353952 RepID=A0A165DIQ2_9BASI|nr:hypothetical protein CALCODRAFT_69483 [Calocera cornea HHB12733]
MRPLHVKLPPCVRVSILRGPVITGRICSLAFPGLAIPCVVLGDIRKRFSMLPRNIASDNKRSRQHNTTAYDSLIRCGTRHIWSFAIPLDPAPVSPQEDETPRVQCMR